MTIPKVKDGSSKAMKCDDFRGIAISPIISKVFECCLVERFSDYLVCSDNEFGFKKQGLKYLEMSTTHREGRWRGRRPRARHGGAKRRSAEWDGVWGAAP